MWYTGHVRHAKTSPVVDEERNPVTLGGTAYNAKLWFGAKIGRTAGEGVLAIVQAANA